MESLRGNELGTNGKAPSCATSHEGAERHTVVMQMLTPLEREELETRAMEQERQPIDVLVASCAEKGLKETARDLSKAAARHKAKEAEDIMQPRMRPPLKRRASIEITSIRDEEIKRRSGAIWKCFDRVPNENGGYLYRFRLREEFDPKKGSSAFAEVSKKNQEIFPAVEPDDSDFKVMILDPKESIESVQEQYLANKIQEIMDDKAEPLFKKFGDSPNKADLEMIKRVVAEVLPPYMRASFRAVPCSGSVEQFRKDLLEALKIEWGAMMKLYIDSFINFPDELNVEIMNDLGYSSYVDSEQNRIVVLPDREALLANWQKLREKRDDLPELNIAPGEGIEGDLAYVEAYFTADVLLSDSVEFVHDHFNHVLSIIRLMLSRPTKELSQAEMYAAEKKRLIKIVIDAYRMIMILEHKVRNSEDVLKVSQEDINKFKTCLGILVDGGPASYPSFSRIDMHHGFTNILPGTVLEGVHYPSSYSKILWKRRYPDEKLDVFMLNAVWTEAVSTYPTKRDLEIINGFARPFSS